MVLTQKWKRLDPIKAEITSCSNSRLQANEKATSSIEIASASKAYHHNFLLPSQFDQHQSWLQKGGQQSNPGTNHKLIIVERLVKAHLSSWNNLFGETVAHPLTQDTLNNVHSPEPLAISEFQILSFLI